MKVFGLTLTLVSIAVMTSACIVISAAGSSVADNPRKSNRPTVKKQKPIESKVSKFMRAKLESAQSVLEGIVTEKFELVEKGAQKMIVMSRAADWQVIQGPIYASDSAEFRRNAKQLIKMAQNKNTDGAALTYLQLTLSCINCHKHVRSAVVVDLGPIVPHLVGSGEKKIVPTRLLEQSAEQ